MLFRSVVNLIINYNFCNCPKCKYVSVHIVFLAELWNFYILEFELIFYKNLKKWKFFSVTLEWHYWIFSLWLCLYKLKECLQILKVKCARIKLLQSQYIWRRRFWNLLENGKIMFLLQFLLLWAIHIFLQPISASQIWTVQNIDIVVSTMTQNVYNSSLSRYLLQTACYLQHHKKLFMWVT